ncbi:MAG TPA: hypothetical protein VF476_09875 [Chitinophagaceae bacterium]
MEANMNNIEERLWNYIDGTSSNEEKTVVEKLLATDTAWKEKYHELLEWNKLLQSSELEAPSMRFSKNVMEEIAKLHIAPATKSYINKKIIMGLGIFFLAMIVGFLIYGFGQVDWSEGESSNIAQKIGNIDYGKFFNNTWVNVFMMINVLLGLVLLDNYLSNKRKEYRKEA